jgi:hypothetical protein
MLMSNVLLSLDVKYRRELLTMFCARKVTYSMILCIAGENNLFLIPSAVLFPAITMDMSQKLLGL